MAIDVLVVGGGSREHALCWKLKQSPRVGKIYIAPGNAGTQRVAENVPIGVMEFETLAMFAEEKKIALTIVGPDDPLGGGIVDVFTSRRLKIFGPTKAAAQIESSKAFAKQLMAEAGVPTAEFQVFKEYEKALDYARAKGAPIVIKASGLARGKGVYVCKTIEEAEMGLKDIMLDKQFGDSGNEVVIEEFLDGQEISIHAFCNGADFMLFPTSQDHKQIGEGDTGPNTGGMGVIAPVPLISKEMLDEIGKTVVKPTLEALAKRGAPYSGVLYPGLKMSSKGPNVLEFNARFGQPECEAYMRLLKTDLLDICESIADGKLPTSLEWNSGFAVNIILASEGYPGSYKKSLPITGIEEAEQMEGVVVFHAGTAEDNDIRCHYKTNGGRVLAVTAIGDTLKEALDRAYAAADKIHFEGKYVRRDIGAKVLN